MFDNIRFLPNDEWKNNKEYMQYLHDIAEGKIKLKYACCCFTNGSGTKEQQENAIKEGIDFDRAFLISKEANK